MRLPPALLRRRTWLIGLPVLLVLGVVVAPWVYLKVIQDDPPDRLSFDDLTTTTAAGSSTSSTSTTTDGLVAEGVEGTWTVADGSRAGYRVKEVLFGQDSEAVGRTTDVTGTLEIAGTTVTAAEVAVDMTTVASSEGRRDGQFRGRIMDTATFPTATFSLTEPIQLDAVPAEGVETTHQVTGDLTLRGVTRPVTFELTARRTAAAIEVSATIAVDFDDFSIPDASGGPASVGRDGELELLLVFTR
ncbi:MAG: YceI family protein [Microthrixaceae bacterium]